MSDKNTEWKRFAEERQATIMAEVLTDALTKLRAAYRGSAADICPLKANEAALLWRILSEHTHLHERCAALPD